MLEKGKVTESGTHDELLAMNGKYAEMSRLALGEGDFDYVGNKGDASKEDSGETHLLAADTPLPPSTPDSPVHQETLLTSLKA